MQITTHTKPLILTAQVNSVLFQVWKSGSPFLASSKAGELLQCSEATSRSIFFPDMKATSGNKRCLQLPKKPAAGPAAHQPTAFNMRMQRANVVAEKKVCSSRQRSLNKTIPHAGLLVAACRNTYTPWAWARCKRRLIWKVYWIHQGNFHLPEKKPASLLRQIISYEIF